MEEEIKTALKKCAVGFGTSEVVEEFSVEDGELKLIKKKVTRRDVPPDIKAVKLLMDGGTESLSDEELEAEMQRLTKLLEDENFE
ncbi:MAG: hypothetical protein K2O41_01890 [Clostridia bacterium]|nr:hypothetical protein [Clostridia bacterium]MDE7181771.1 hypothetical protein [Clostridia bacterium]